jgi:hypothetical protein
VNRAQNWIVSKRNVSIGTITKLLIGYFLRVVISEPAARSKGIRRIWVWRIDENFEQVAQAENSLRDPFLRNDPEIWPESRAELAWLQ